MRGWRAAKRAAGDLGRARLNDGGREGRCAASTPTARKRRVRR